MMPRWYRFASIGLLGAALCAPDVSFGQLRLPRGRGSSRQEKEQPSLPESTTVGMVRRIDADWLILEADDHRIVSFRLSAKTVMQKQAHDAKVADFRPGDHVTVDASTTETGQLIAMTVTFDKAGTSGEYARASRPVPVDDSPLPVRRAEQTGAADPDDEKPRLRRAGAKPKEEAGERTEKESAAVPEADPEPARDRPTTIVQDSDALEKDRPRVRRGIQASRPRSAEEEETVAVVTPPPPPPGGAPAPTPQARPADATAEPAARATDPFIEKTREAIEHFSEGLPSYTVQQNTTRYMSDTPKAQFKPQDVVSADVVYEKGRERYRNIKVNNKATKKSMEEVGGAWSTGEFATTIQDVFSPASNADFRFRRSQSIVGRSAKVYDYRVARENSHWTMLTTSQTYKPAYQGRVWIDEQTHLVLRLEMEAKGLPQDFPLDHVEMTLDYDFVRLSGPTFLLPVQSENLSCQRGTSFCSKNATEFRNYRKYSSDSSVTFDQ